MNEEAPILPLIVAGLLLTCFGLEVERRKKKLRSVFDVFDKEESKIATALEEMVIRGEITPYIIPKHPVASH